MGRRRKPSELAQPSGAPETSILAKIMNSQNRVMTRSQRRALESLSNCNTIEAEAELCSPKKQRREEPKPEEESAGSETELVLEQYKGVQRTLGTRYLDVVERMKLNYTPHCALRSSFCRTHHWETCAPVRLAEKDLKSKTMHFLSQERYPNFIKFVEDMCNRNEFPGLDIISHIWEIILTVQIPDHENYSTNWVIDECVFLFEKIIFMFPPCWRAIRESYTKLLTIPISNENILPSRHSSAQTILQFVVFKLSQLIKEEPAQQKNKLREEIFNVHEWEMKNRSNQNFEDFSREQKLDRLFVILHQVVKVMELDLAAWIPRYAEDPRNHMIGAERPFVCTVFGLNQFTCLTNLVKQTLDLYVSCVCFSYPPNQVAHLTRLVSLLAVVINLGERSTRRELTFPNIGQVTKDFVKEIYKVIEGLIGTQMELILMVITDIKIPFVKYLLINELLCKLDGDREEMSVKKVMDSFRNHHWLKCELANKNVKLPIRSASEFKYPIIPKKILKAPKAVIYRDVYLNILLTGFKAYCDFYAIKDIAKLFAQKKPNEPSVIENKSPHKAIADSEELDISRIEGDIEAHVAQMDLKEPLPSKLDEESQCFEGIHVDANVMKNYRSELKCLLILRKNIPILRERHGSIFDEFYNFTQEVF